MRLEVDDMCVEVFLQTMLAISATDTALLHTGMEALDGLEVEAVDIGFSELQFTAYPCSGVQCRWPTR